MDPSTSDYYAYGLTKDRKYYEIGATLESPANQGQTSFIITRAHADEDNDYAYVL